MQQDIHRPRGTPVRHAGQPRRPVRSALSVALAAALPLTLSLLGLGAATPAQAFEYGPFSLTGFAKLSVGRVSNG